MYAPFYSPVCEDDEYVIADEAMEYECVHRCHSGLGFALPAAAATAAAGGPPGWVISAALMGVSALISVFAGRKRGKQKEATTQIVNEAEPLLQQNLAAWNGSGRTVSEQAQALANFDAVWEGVRVQCSDPAFGPPGEWCVDDRKRGGKWDWFARYRDPIANDSGVQPDPSFIEGLLPSQLADINTNMLMGLVGAGLLLGVALLGGSQD